MAIRPAARTSEDAKVRMSLTQRAGSFLKDVRVESRKVTYPSRKELRDSTIVVIVTVILLSVFTGIVDRIFGFLLAQVLR